jgi:hypothetical protein
MPYYKITIWLKDQRKPVEGIRQYELKNLDAVYINTKRKAEALYRSNLIDVEVLMYSRHSPTIKKYLEGVERKREDKRYINMPSTPTPAKPYNRKDSYGGNKTPIGEKKK